MASEAASPYSPPLRHRPSIECLPVAEFRCSGSREPTREEQQADVRGLRPDSKRAIKEERRRPRSTPLTPSDAGQEKIHGNERQWIADGIPLECLQVRHG